MRRREYFVGPRVNGGGAGVELSWIDNYPVSAFAETLVERDGISADEEELSTYVGAVLCGAVGGISPLCTKVFA
jgi:hypothetical protein